LIWERWDSPRAPEGGQSGEESGERWWERNSEGVGETRRNWGRCEPHGQEVGGIKIYLEIIC